MPRSPRLSWPSPRPSRGSRTWTRPSPRRPWLYHHPAAVKVLALSPALGLSSFGTFTGIGPSDTINHVTVAVTHHEAAGSLAPVFELWDGTSAQIGADQAGTASAPDHTDSADITGVTYAQLATLQVRVYGHATPAWPRRSTPSR